MMTTATSQLSVPILTARRGAIPRASLSIRAPALEATPYQGMDHADSKGSSAPAATAMPQLRTPAFFHTGS